MPYANALWNLNLRHLRALSATARLGSISAAAQAIAISQPAITQALAKLEGDLGHVFFERRSDGMVPTEAARLFTPRIDAALAHIQSSRVTAPQMRAFIALSDHGNYAAAGAAIGVSGPSLHRAVADLDVALRRSLLEKRGRGVALTEAGKRWARRFRLARAELEAGLSELAELAGRESGRIVIGAMPLSRARVLPAAVANFQRAHPDVAVSIVEGSFAELIEPLRDGSIDMMIGALRDPAPGPDVEQAPLFTDTPVVIGRMGHPLATTAKGLRKLLPAREHPTPNLSQLAEYGWIVPAIGTPLRTQWQRLFAPLPAPPPVPVECGSVITIRQLLMASDHLTLLSPDQVAVEMEAGWLTIIGPAPEGLARNIGLTTRSAWRPTARQAGFIACLEAASAPSSASRSPSPGRGGS